MKDRSDDPSHHGFCYISRGAMAGGRNSSMGPPWRIDPTTHHTMSKRSYHRDTSRSHATMAAYSGMFLYVILTSNVRYVKCPNESTDESWSMTDHASQSRFTYFFCRNLETFLCLLIRRMHFLCMRIKRAPPNPQATLQEKSTGNLNVFIEKHYNKNSSTAMKLTCIKHIFTSFITVQNVFCFYFMSKTNQQVISCLLLKNTTIKTRQQQWNSHISSIHLLVTLVQNVFCFYFMSKRNQQVICPLLYNKNLSTPMKLTYIKHIFTSLFHYFNSKDCLLN